MNNSRNNRPKKAVYALEHQLRRRLNILKRIRLDLRASRELAWRLLVKNLRAPYGLFSGCLI